MYFLLSEIKVISYIRYMLSSGSENPWRNFKWFNSWEPKTFLPWYIFLFQNFSNSSQSVQLRAAGLQSVVLACHLSHVTDQHLSQAHTRYTSNSPAYTVQPVLVVYFCSRSAFLGSDFLSVVRNRKRDKLDWGYFISIRGQSFLFYFFSSELSLIYILPVIHNAMFGNLSQQPTHFRRCI